MDKLSERKMETLEAIDDFVESLVGPEFFMSAESGRDGTYEITIAIPREAFCIKDNGDA